MIISASKDTAKKFDLSKRERHLLQDTRSEKKKDKAQWVLLRVERINYHNYEPLKQTWLRVTKKHITLVTETFEADDLAVDNKAEITGSNAVDRVVDSKCLSTSEKVKTLKALQASDAFNVKVKGKLNCETEEKAQGRLEDVLAQLIIALSEGTLEQSSLKTYVPSILDSTQKDTKKLEALIQVNRELTSLLHTVDRLVNPTEDDD